MIAQIQPPLPPTRANFSGKLLEKTVLSPGTREQHAAAIQTALTRYIALYQKTFEPEYSSHKNSRPPLGLERCFVIKHHKIPFIGPYLDYLEFRLDLILAAKRLYKRAQSFDTPVAKDAKNLTQKDFFRRPKGYFLFKGFDKNDRGSQRARKLIDNHMDFLNKKFAELKKEGFFQKIKSYFVLDAQHKIIQGAPGKLASNIYLHATKNNVEPENAEHLDDQFFIRISAYCFSKVPLKKESGFEANGTVGFTDNFVGREPNYSRARQDLSTLYHSDFDELMKMSCKTEPILALRPFKQLLTTKNTHVPSLRTAIFPNKFTPVSMPLIGNALSIQLFTLRTKQLAQLFKNPAFSQSSLTHPFLKEYFLYMREYNEHVKNNTPFQFSTEVKLKLGALTINSQQQAIVLKQLEKSFKTITSSAVEEDNVIVDNHSRNSGTIEKKRFVRQTTLAPPEITFVPDKTLPGNYYLEMSFSPSIFKLPCSPELEAQLKSLSPSERDAYITKLSESYQNKADLIDSLH
jgi:hypothetical protein